MSSIDIFYTINQTDIDKISSDQSDNLIDFNTISNEEIERLDFNDCSIIKQAALTPLPTFEYFNSLDAKKQKQELRSLYMKISLNAEICQHQQTIAFQMFKNFPFCDISEQNIKSSVDKSSNRIDFSEYHKESIQHLDFDDPSVLEQISLSPLPTFDDIDVKEKRFECKKLLHKLLISSTACEDHRERFFFMFKKITKARFDGTDN